MDWNNDGYDDILVGDRNGYVSYFERNSDGSLKAYVRLKSGGAAIDAGYNSAPDFVDWDNDGDLDMLVGSYYNSTIRLYVNTGTISAYKFDGYTDLKIGTYTPKYAGSYPSFYDMNDDGLFDIVIGGISAKFHYFENTGTLGNPDFASDSPLKYGNGNIAKTPTAYSRPEIADWNNDGFPDIISGAASSNDFVYLYLGIPTSTVEENHSGVIVASRLSIGENPVRTNLSASFDLAEAATSDFTVYNVNGRVELTHATNLLERGYNTVTIPNSLPNGTYVLRCTTGNSELAERFVVVR